MTGWNRCPVFNDRCVVKFKTAVFLFLTSLFLTDVALAASVTIETSKPLSDGVVLIEVTSGGVTQTVVVNNITSTMTEQEKRATILLGLIANGYDVDTGPQSITINSLKSGTQVIFSSQTTGEGFDKLTATNIAAFIEFDGGFDQLDSLGNISTFLAGFSTDIGSVTQSFLADDFADLTASTIASTFYDALVIPADLIGINLTLSGSSLIASYDPGVHGESVEFGTTSGAGTVAGSVTLPVPPISLLFVSGLISLGLSRKGFCNKREHDPHDIPDVLRECCQTCRTLI